jgi:hypothetical protein
MAAMATVPAPAASCARDGAHGCGDGGGEVRLVVFFLQDRAGHRDDEHRAAADDEVRAAESRAGLDGQRAEAGKECVGHCRAP